MGGTDDPENLIELTIEEHAEAHRILYEKYGKWQDYYAWKGLSGQIGREEILKQIHINNGKNLGNYMFENKLGIFSMTKEERLPYLIKGGKTAGKQHAESGHCQRIAHLGGKASAGMPYWYNEELNIETRSFESPGKDWVKGVKMERVNIEQLRKQSSNRKGSFWIHNPDTGESKMIFDNEPIPEGFKEGRQFNIKNTIDLLNIGDNSDIDGIKKIKSEFNEIKFDNWYKRWLLTFRINKKVMKITHIDYWTLVWARDVIINKHSLNKKLSEHNFNDDLSKEEVVDRLKSFREYLKIEKILQGKMKKSRRDIYERRLNEYEKDYNFLIRIRNQFL